ncbi:MAG: cell division protein FtsZ [Thermoanaerobaculum sp.]|nr:cell division protein FtsZ [Thermoanaerobaculum sp.]MDW7968277.1 cell division protein FtsZ [Thermoanaerobaculum sp.]
MITFDDAQEQLPVIMPDEAQAPAVLKVVGVGGGGCNAITRMISAGVKGVEFIAVNTDGQSLERCPAPTKVQLLTPNSRGRALGAGGNPKVGKEAALQKTDELLEVLAGADMVFIAAGMGGGTGTGAAPVIGRLAKESGALTVAVVNTPFSFEASERMRIAQQGLAELASCVDTLIVVPNARLEEMAPADMTFKDAFLLADQALHHGVRGISEIINEVGVINRDFADVKAVLEGGGMALMGIGVASGTHRALEAAHHAVSSPLLDNVALQGAQRVLVNFVTGPDATLGEISEAARWIRQQCAENCTYLFGYVQRDDFQDQIQVTIIATGFSATERPEAKGLGQAEPQPKRGEVTTLNPFLPAGSDVPNFGVRIRPDDFHLPTVLRRQLD